MSEYGDPDIGCFGYFANGGQQYLITGDRGGTVKVGHLLSKYMFAIYILQSINNPLLLLNYQIWDMHTQTLVEIVEGVHLSSVSAICCHPEGEHPMLVTASDDETVCLWNPTTLR